MKSLGFGLELDTFWLEVQTNSYNLTDKSKWHLTKKTTQLDYSRLDKQIFIISFFLNILIGH